MTIERQFPATAGDLESLQQPHRAVRYIVGHIERGNPPDPYETEWANIMLACAKRIDAGYDQPCPLVPLDLEMSAR